VLIPQALIGDWALGWMLECGGLAGNPHAHGRRDGRFADETCSGQPFLLCWRDGGALDGRLEIRAMGCIGKVAVPAEPAQLEGLGA